MVTWGEPVPQTAGGRDHVQRVDLAIAPNARQRRWTVLIRFFLAIPHFVILYFLSIAALVIMVMGWFGALFTGRLPSFAAEFLSGYVRWSIRVQAYMFFLTDSYPPFTLDPAPAYPIQLAIRPGRLNRWAVGFRVVLVVPAYAVTALLTFGAGIISVVSWLVTLIMGRLPEAFSQGYRVVVRLLARQDAYWYLLSADYPWWGLFGDEAGQATLQVPPPGYYLGAGAPPYPPPPAPPYPPPPAAAPLSFQPPPAGQPQGAPPPSTPATVPEPADQWSPPSVDLPPDDPAWRMRLDGGGKALVMIMLVVAVLGWVTEFTVGFVSGANAVSARNQTTAAYDSLVSGVDQFSTAVRSCTTVRCVRNAAAQAAGDLHGFGSSVGRISYPTAAVGDAQALQNSAASAEETFIALSHAPSLFAYDSYGVQARNRLNTVDVDYHTLIDELNSLS